MIENDANLTEAFITQIATQLSKLHLNRQHWFQHTEVIIQSEMILI